MLWSPNLQLHYPLENQANDYSGNARHGTVNGSGVYATRPSAGRCLYFDGVGDYVATPSFGLSGTVVIFTCWVRSKHNIDYRQAFIGDNAEFRNVGYFLSRRFQNSYDLSWEYANIATTDIAFATDFFLAPFDDTWLHLLIACDYAGKTCYFYRNGLLLSTASMSGTPLFPATARVKYLGSYNSTPAFPIIEGYLANVQLWTLASMPAAAQMLANANRLMLGMNPIF